MRGVKYVVLDEADILLCGGFQNKVICLLNMLRFDEKLLPQSKESVSEITSGPSLHFTLEDKEDLQTDIISEGEENSEDVHIDDLAEDVEAGSNKTKDWRRVRKNYESSKQYICVTATLTVNGKKTAGAVLKQMFTDANWVSGNYLHCHNPRLKLQLRLRRMNS
ncbi:DEAD-box ATP-dependent RNA helicase 22-like [Quercus lobata]|uniref:DEAD-box ATP-dependent RNA helicase 22-like n=1 Tax=Quercus lobata TaxID=97700 RepID=UPI001249190A|nr:DEAD-box ATP-dependent RNA helicase 22-like [Quercus lobata]XP_030961299.1 DEAD-box ATP-dependent RNA helicase 22-like [Quercus lobata]